jgi:hypothetical protein
MHQAAVTFVTLGRDCVRIYITDEYITACNLYYLFYLFNDPVLVTKTK